MYMTNTYAQGIDYEIMVQAFTTGIFQKEIRGQLWCRCLGGAWLWCPGTCLACPVSVHAEVRSVSCQQVILISGRSNTTLSEVGQLEALRLQGNYDTGQMFLHKVSVLLGQIWENTSTLYQVFGYRGVILFPWLARVYDRDMPSKPPNTRSACFFVHTISQLVQIEN